MEPNPYSGLLTFLPITLMSVFIAVTANLLAREKGRRVVVWTILGSIPIINFICLSYFIGAANLRLEAKLDRLLSAFGKGT
jgi:hypothetical protein